MGGKVGLRIKIDEDDFFSRVGESGAEVGGGGRLADAAFLVEEGDDAHKKFRVGGSDFLLGVVCGKERRESSDCRFRGKAPEAYCSLALYSRAILTMGTKNPRWKDHRGFFVSVATGVATNGVTSSFSWPASSWRLSSLPLLSPPFHGLSDKKKLFMNAL